MTDITYKQENYKFNYRVAFIIKQKNNILLEKNEDNSFYSLPGGRVKLGENSIQAVKREIKEEIGIDVDKKDLKLNSISENFFNYNFKNFHEILFTYEIVIADLIELQEMVNLDNEKVKLFWIDINNLNDLVIKPKQLNEYVKNSEIHYIIENDLTINN